MSVRNTTGPLDSEGKRLLSRRVSNDEADILALVGEIAGVGADDVM